MNARKILLQAKMNNGISINSEGTEPTQGYMVSIPGEETRVNILDIWTIETYITILDQLNLYYYLGIWKEGKTWYLDISVNILDIKRAKQLGNEYNQKAVWDVVNKKEIYLK